MAHFYIKLLYPYTETDRYSQELWGNLCKLSTTEMILLTIQDFWEQFKFAKSNSDVDKEK